MNNQTLVELQGIELEILREVKRICNKYKLEYYLIGGTLLGAIRHKGFIPWDDDIDIAMPRKDYEKFIRLCDEELDGKYYLDYITTQDIYVNSFVKIRKANTFVNEKHISEIKCKKGIFIDIFPLDNAKRQNSLFQSIQAKIVKGMYPIIFYRCGANKNRLSKKTIFFGTLSKFLSIKSLNKIRDFIMKTNKNEKSKYYVSLGSRYDYVKETILKDKYYPHKEAEFEGELFNIPNDYKYILTRIYGENYMDLPPIEKRVNHEIDKVIFKCN